METIFSTPFLNESEAARRLGLSSKTLRNWRAQLTGPPYLKLGSAVRYHITALDDWALEQKAAA